MITQGLISILFYHIKTSSHSWETSFQLGLLFGQEGGMVLVSTEWDRVFTLAVDQARLWLTPCSVSDRAGVVVCMCRCMEMQ